MNAVRPRLLWLLSVTAPLLFSARVSAAPSASQEETAGLAALTRGDTAGGVELLRQALDAGHLSPRGTYRLAAALGNARSRGEICPFHAFRGEIVRLLTLATTADPSLWKRAQNDGAFLGVHDTIGYQALAGRLASREEDVPEILSRVRFWGAGLPQVGSTAGAKLERSRRVTVWRTVMTPAGATEKQTEVGTWSVAGRELSFSFGRRSQKGRLLPTGVLVIDGLGELRDEPAECTDEP